MKLVLIFISVFFTLVANSQEDYVLQLNDTTLNVALDKPYNLVVKGKKIGFKLIQSHNLCFPS